jgi:CBS domain-containing protein
MVTPGERPLVGDAMHRGVVSCHPETRAIAVLRMMAAHRIHSVVVTDGQSAPRLVSDADVAAALCQLPIATQTAVDLAHPAPLLRRSESVSSALARMHEFRSTHAVVVDSQRSPVGVLSILDIAEAVLSLSNSPHGDPGAAGCPPPTES